MAKELSELDRIWESYKEDQRALQEELGTINVEICRLSAVYEECRKLWMEGNFKRLSDALDKEGFRFFHELSKKLLGLSDKADGVRKRLDGVNKELKEGIVCPRCDGTGSIVAEKRYERSEEQIIPIIRTQKCLLCKGSGKLRPDRPV